MDSIYETDYYDSLTNLPNVAQFRNLAEKLLDSAQMRRQGIAFVYFNIENFKSFNRKYGVEAGDELLKTISQLLQSTFQGRVVARLDVDHFAVIAEQDGLERKLEELCEDVHSFRRATRVELKAGIYLVDDQVTDANVAIDRAMMACNAIRNQYDVKYGYFDPLAEKQQQRENTMVDSFVSDMADGNILLYFQPIVRALTNQVCAFETLTRWKNASLGLLMPEEFIRVLERHGLARKLDLYVVEQVCLYMQKKLSEGVDPVPVSINFSETDFRTPGLVRDVDRIVKKYKIPTEFLCIEISESAFGDEFGFIKESIRDFRRLGYEVWMDDFGRGYSALNSLKDYDFDAIKIDLKFLKDFEKNPRAGVILIAMIDMAKRLNLRTIAEGVETEEACDFLKESGCELMQGFLFGKPEPYGSEFFQDLDLVIEKAEERSYQNRVGQINLYGPGFLARRMDPNGLMPGGLPMAVLELQNGNLHYLRTNDAFSDFLKQTGDGTIARSENFLNQKEGKFSSLFAETMQKCRLSGKPESIDFVRNGQYCNMRIRMIDYDQYKTAFLVTCLNLSEFTHPETWGKREESLRYIYSTYNRVDLIAGDGSGIEAVYVRDPDKYPGFESGEVKDAIRGYASKNIEATDRLQFLHFFDMDTVQTRILQSSENLLTDYFPTRSGDEGFKWARYQLIPSEYNGRNMFLSCISDVDTTQIQKLQRKVP